MSDLLVKLYDLANDWSFIADQAAKGITLRKPIGPEFDSVIAWVKGHFGAGWASETAAGLANRPVTCFIALKEERMIGFACYDATALGFFGPTGVAEEHRGKGSGKALLLACMLDMKLAGYGYAVIGSAGPVEFYRKAVGAVVIPDSSPGVYKGMVKPEHDS